MRTSAGCCPDQLLRDQSSLAMEMTWLASTVASEPPGSGGETIGFWGEERNSGRVVGSTDAVAKIGGVGVWLKRQQQGRWLEKVRQLGSCGLACSSPDRTAGHAPCRAGLLLFSADPASFFCLFLLSFVFDVLPWYSLFPHKNIPFDFLLYVWHKYCYNSCSKRILKNCLQTSNIFYYFHINFFICNFKKLEIIIHKLNTQNRKIFFLSDRGSTFSLHLGCFNFHIYTKIICRRHETIWSI